MKQKVKVQVNKLQDMMMAGKKLSVDSNKNALHDLKKSQNRPKNRLNAWQQG